jgi:hypothetical protein
LELFTPLYKSKNSENRIKWIREKFDSQNLNHLKILADIAKNDISLNVREAAVEKLINQELLYDLAKNDNDLNVRKAAVERLTKQSLLADVARNGIDLLICNIAFDKMFDQSLLTDIAKNANHKLIRKVAVEKIDDQIILSEIAQNEKENDVRKTAVEKLTSQILLVKIASNDKDCDVRQSAVKKLTEQNILGDIAKNDKEFIVRKAAVEKLDDQNILQSVVKYINDEFIRKIIVEKLISQTILSDIATTDENWEVRKAAVEKLTNDGILNNVALSDKDYEVRQLAFNILGKENCSEALSDKARNDKVRKVRIDAIKMLSDQNLLADISKNDVDWNIRQAAVEMLIDQKLIVDIAKNDKNLQVRKTAVEKLTDQSLLSGFILEKDFNDAIEILIFPEGIENRHANNLSLLKYLRKKNVLPALSIFSMELIDGSPKERLIVVTGTEKDCLLFDRVFYLPEADEFVESKFNDDWNQVNAKLTLSNIGFMPIASLNNFNRYKEKIKDGSFQLLERITISDITIEQTKESCEDLKKIENDSKKESLLNVESKILESLTVYPIDKTIDRFSLLKILDTMTLPHWKFSCIGFKDEFIRDIVISSNVIYCIAESKNKGQNLWFSEDLGVTWEIKTIPNMKYVWKLHIYPNGKLIVSVSLLNEKGTRLLIYDKKNDVWETGGNGLATDNFSFIEDIFFDSQNRLFVKVDVEGKKGKSLLCSDDYGKTFDLIVEGLTSYFVSYDTRSLAQEYREGNQLLYSTNHLASSRQWDGHLHIIDIKKRKHWPILIPFEEMMGNQSLSVLADRYNPGVLYVTGYSGNLIYESDDFARKWKKLPLLSFAENARSITFWGYYVHEPYLPLISVKESDHDSLYFWDKEGNQIFLAASLPEGCQIQEIRGIFGGAVVLATNKGVLIGELAKTEMVG